MECKLGPRERRKGTLPKSPSGLGKMIEISRMPTQPSASHSVGCTSVMGPPAGLAVSFVVGRWADTSLTL